ncbi:putative bifunctional diguanylate cyclase/phosphodiesterase [Acidicapsa ligni]|uniref:putative bifunctional diguanylate cyclase/phosphodiesterase n=1 Tax=Acidicapsa ligni TaxID=542300 RepID=UPI0021E04B58|nr:bifunctional diguanylate cyclase/phosphodiesterase [Acidicapsa ligni]
MKPVTQQTLGEEFFFQSLEYGFHHDLITSLPNYVSFRKSLKQMLGNAAAAGQEIAVLWIDVLNLRREYSIGGDEGAERLIRTVADSLRPWVNGGELISRYSDQCFVIALRSDDRIEARLNWIVEEASHLHIRGSEGKPEIAAGVAFFPEDANSSEDLIRFASVAAVSAAGTRGRYAVPFQPEMNVALLQERSLEKDLRIALHEHQLTLVYQPQIDLRTGDILGVEGLTRWDHPTRGPVSPTQFIPVAERSNLIHEIFAHSLRRLLIDAASWRAAGVTMPSVAVNASAANVRQEDFVSIVERELAANPLGHNTQLDIEMTESLLMDDEDLFSERLKGLRAIGVNVSLDDFGTRYTGFNALKGLPLNTMKIDKCFVHGVDRSAQAQSLCQTIVVMARQLNLKTIAEGVEDFGELRALREIGCNAGQGYLFQKPVPSDQLLRFVHEWPERKKQGKFACEFLDVDVNLQNAPNTFSGIV